MTPRVWSRRLGAPQPPTGEPAVYVGRPTRWGNPHVIKGDMDRADAICLFRSYAEDRLRKDPRWLDPLIGKHLLCWCAPLPCHADVLLELLQRDART